MDWIADIFGGGSKAKQAKRDAEEARERGNQAVKQQQEERERAEKKKRESDDAKRQKEEADRKAREADRKRLNAEEEKNQAQREKENALRQAQKAAEDKSAAKQREEQERALRLIAEDKVKLEQQKKDEAQQHAKAMEVKWSKETELRKEVEEQLKTLTPKPAVFRGVTLDASVLEEKKKKLMEDVPYDKNIRYLNLLLYGLVGHGKTSFVNTVHSTLRGNIAPLCPVGKGTTSITKQFRMHRFRSEGKKTVDISHFRLCDTMGFEGHEGISTRDISAILHGHVKDNYTFNPVKGIDPSNRLYLKHPNLSDEMHCVGICVHAGKLSVLQGTALEKMKGVKEEINESGLNFIIILTNIDTICPMVELDPAKTFYSDAVERAIKDVAEIFGVPENHVFPIKNYSKEVELDPAISVMALYACQKLVDFGNAYLENKLDSHDLVMGQKQYFILAIVCFVVIVIAIAIMI